MVLILVVKVFSFAQVSLEVLLWMLVINLIRISRPLWVVVSHFWQDTFPGLLLTLLMSLMEEFVFILVKTDGLV